MVFQLVMLQSSEMVTFKVLSMLQGKIGTETSLRNSSRWAHKITEELLQLYVVSFRFSVKANIVMEPVC